MAKSIGYHHPPICLDQNLTLIAPPPLFGLPESVSLWVFSFIGTDRSGPIPRAKSIRLLVRSGSDRFIVGPGRNRLLRTGPFLTWLAVELSNSGSTKWYVLERLELFVYCGPVHTKLKWSVPINEHTLYNPITTMLVQWHEMCMTNQSFLILRICTAFHIVARFC
jgi:hypothetical protein